MAYDEELYSLIASCTDEDINSIKDYLSNISDIEKFLYDMRIFENSIGKPVSILEMSVLCANYKLLEYLLSLSSNRVKKSFFEDFTLNAEYNNFIILQEYARQLSESKNVDDRKVVILGEIKNILQYAERVDLKNLSRTTVNDKGSNSNSNSNSNQLDQKEKHILYLIESGKNDELEKCFYDNPDLIYLLSGNKEEQITLLQVAHKFNNKFAIQMIMKIFAHDAIKRKSTTKSGARITEQKYNVLRDKGQDKSI